MTATRLLFVHLLILALIGGHLYDIVTRQEHWPFSDYPMFSTVHRKAVLEWPRLFGITEAGGEYALLKYAHLFPLDQSRMPLGLRSLYRNEGGGERLHEAIADIYRRYEWRRLAGQHDGPRIRGVRLYLVSWPLEPYAANLDRPALRRLIAQTEASKGGRP